MATWKTLATLEMALTLMQINKLAQLTPMLLPMVLTQQVGQLQVLGGVLRSKLLVNLKINECQGAMAVFLHKRMGLRRKNGGSLRR